MDAKRTIQKILFVMLWLAIGTGMLTLLVAAIGKKNRDKCAGYDIKIIGAQNNLFVDQKDVLQLLTANSGNIKGRLISSINLRSMETLLEDNVWIKDAQLYFDNQDKLHVLVEESEPVARVFTTSGNSFYINENKIRMPLSDKVSAKVPVFTNFPEGKVLSEKDSVLLDDLKTTAVFIMNNPFWMAQVAQLDITEHRTFEMIPTVGNHIVKLGDGKQIDKKFDRLFIFYKQILSKTGFDRYPVIDIQFAGQVVATKNGTSKTRIDTSQLRLNVQRLLQQAKQVQNENTDEEQSAIEKPKIDVDTSTASPKSFSTNTGVKKTSDIKIEEKSTNPNPMKPTLESRNDDKKETEKKVPKAVMPKKDST